MNINLKNKFQLKFYEFVFSHFMKIKLTFFVAIGEDNPRLILRNTTL